MVRWSTVTFAGCVTKGPSGRVSRASARASLRRACYAGLASQGQSVRVSSASEQCEGVASQGKGLYSPRYPKPVMAELLAAPLIRDVPDFPKPGIIFKDITPVLEDPAAFQEVIDLLAEDAIRRGAEVIVGIESRGFVFGTPLALKCKLPFAMARKLGKLPYERITEEYALEYGTNTVEMHTDAIKPGQKAYIVDDLLATGGTAGAARRLVERLGGEVVGFGCMIELTFLNGRHNLLGMPVTALMEF